LNIEKQGFNNEDFKISSNNKELYS